MTLSYLPVRFSLRFDTPATADTPPLFVLRSMLGKHLRSMCCIAHKNICADCMYNATCAHSFLFETILSKDNAAVSGRDRASHPFAFTRGKNERGTEISDYDFTLTLFGKAAEYLPYIYAALVRSGKDGLFKSRTPFSVTAVCVGEKNILRDEEHLDTSVPASVWKYDDSLKLRSGEILVELKSPLRFKVDGKYGTDFTAQQFFSCLYRRMKTLCLLYGSADEAPDFSAPKQIAIEEKNIRWQEDTHYSARQKNAMRLGGTVGTLRLSGTFGELEQNVLEFARIANAGKNTNFGLGQMDFWVKWE